MTLPITALCFLAATLPALAGPLPLPGGIATMVPGTTTTLTLTEVQDSRCPANVDCIWEGTIRLSVTATPANGPTQTATLCNLCETATRQATIAGLTLSLTALTPSTTDLAALGRPITLADYTALIEVTPAP